MAFIMSSTAASETFGIGAKPWHQVIEDLIEPYQFSKERKDQK
jgi:hypothetical protein